MSDVIDQAGVQTVVQGLAVLVQGETIGFEPAAWVAVQQAQEAIRTACEDAARTALESRREPLSEALTAAQEALEKATADLVPGDEILAAKQDELRRVGQMLAECEAVSEDTELTIWLAAVGQKMALELRQVELQSRIGIVRDTQSPLVARLAQTRAAVAAATDELDTLDRAIGNPLGSTEGLNTAPGQYWLTRGEWFSHLDFKGTHGRATRRLLTDVLDASGLGRELQQHVVDATRRQQQQREGLVIGEDPRFAYASRPAADVSKLPPRVELHSVNAEIEAAQVRELAGRNPDGTPAAARPQPMPYIAASDISGMPDQWKA